MELERPLIRLNGQEPLWRAIQPTFPFFPPHSACTTSRRCRLPLLAFDTLGQALMSSRSVQISLPMFLIAFHPIFREWRNLVERRPSHEIGARLQTGCLARNFARPNPRYIRTESISFIDKWWLNGSIKTRRRDRHFRDEFGVETTGIAVLYHTGHKKTFIVRHWTHYVTRTRDPSRRDSRTMAR